MKITDIEQFVNERIDSESNEMDAMTASMLLVLVDRREDVALEPEQFGDETVLVASGTHLPAEVEALNADPSIPIEVSERINTVDSEHAYLA